MALIFKTKELACLVKGLFSKTEVEHLLKADEKLRKYFT